MSDLLDGDSETTTSAATATTDSPGQRAHAGNDCRPTRPSRWRRSTTAASPTCRRVRTRPRPRISPKSSGSIPIRSGPPKSILMQAYAHYQRNAYDDTINAANRFITLHPGHKMRPMPITWWRSPTTSRSTTCSATRRAPSRRSNALEEVSGAFRTAPMRPMPARGPAGARSSRRQGNGSRPLLSEARLLSRRHQPLQDGGYRLSDDGANSRRRSTALPKATWRLASPRKRRPRRPCWATISRTASGTRTPIRWWPAMARRRWKTSRAGSARRSGIS